MTATPEKIIVCTNFRPFSGQPSCAFRGSEGLADYLEKEAQRRGISIEVDRSVCLGHCPLGPNVRRPGQAFIHAATTRHLDDLLDEIETGQG